MACLVNQIIFVCAMLRNFFPPLVPPPVDKNAKQKHLGCKKRRSQSEAAAI